MTMTRYPHSDRQGGFSMLEVLIAMVISSVGLLGLAALQNIAQQQEYESYQRSQALIILQDMVNRLTANNGAAGCYAFTTDTTNGTPYIGQSGTYTSTCTGGYGTIDTRARANDDITAITDELNGSSATATVNGTTINTGGLLGAIACISYNSTDNYYTLSVSWEGTSVAFTPKIVCGGTGDKYRRTVSTTVTF